METGSLVPSTAAHLVSLFIFRGLTSGIRVSHFSQWDLTSLETSWECARRSSSYSLWHLHLLHNPKTTSRGSQHCMCFWGQEREETAESKRNSRSKWVQKIPFPHKFLSYLTRAEEGLGIYHRHSTAEQCSLRKGQRPQISTQWTL